MNRSAKKSAKKSVKKQTKKKPTSKKMKGGVSAQTHYQIYPQQNTTYHNHFFDLIDQFVSYLDPFLIHGH